MTDKKLGTRDIGSNITVLSYGFVCSYLYKGHSNPICVDAGLNVKKVKQEFEKSGLNTGDVEAVFLTHSDRDHAGGISAFPDAKVFMSFEEDQMIYRKKARFFGLTHNKRPGCTVNYTVDNDEITIGDTKIKCISTPGHTLGSMSFLVDEKYLFVGDALNLKDGEAVMDRRVLQMDRKLQEESIRKLAGLDGIELMLTAHTGFTDDFNKAMNRWKQS